MRRHDLLSHLSDIISLTYEEGMDVYKNMRIVRGKVMSLLTLLRVEDREPTDIFLYDEDYKPVPPPAGFPLKFDSMADAMQAITKLQVPKVILKSETVSYEVNRVE